MKKENEAIIGRIFGEDFYQKGSLIKAKDLVDARDKQFSVNASLICLRQMAHHLLQQIRVFKRVSSQGERSLVDAWGSQGERR